MPPPVQHHVAAGPLDEGPPATATTAPPTAEPSTVAIPKVPKSKAQSEKAERPPKATAEPAAKKQKCNGPTNRTGRIDDHSVASREVVSISLREQPIDAPQTICAFMQEQIQSNAQSFVIYDDGDIGITGHLTWPNIHDEVASYRGRTLYPRFCPQGVFPCRFNIGYGHSKLTDTITLPADHAFLRAGRPSFEALVDVLMCKMNRNMAEGFVSYFRTALRRYDLSLLWTVGALIEQQLWDIAQANIAPIFAPPHAEDVQSSI